MKNKVTNLLYFLKNAYSSKVTLQIFIIVSVILVIPVVGMTSYWYYLGDSAMKRELQETYDNESSRIVDRMEQTIGNQLQAISVLTQDSKIINLKSSKTSRFFDEVKSIQEEISDLQKQYPSLGDVEIYQSENSYLITADSASKVSKDTRIKKYQMFMLNMEGRTSFLRRADELDYVGGIYRYRRPWGLVYVTMNEGWLKDSIEQLLRIDGAAFYILDDEGMISAVSGEESRQDIRDRIWQDSTHKPSDITEDSQKYQLLWNVSEQYPDLSYCLSIPLPTSNAAGSIGILIAILAVVIISALLLSLILSYMLYRPILTIVRMLKDMSYGRTDLEKLGTKRFDEVSFIKDTILGTQLDNEFLKREVELRQINMERAQTMALQYQINPHFLYNTLEAINWKAIEILKGPNEVSKMISLLSKLFRKSLDSTSFITTMNIELEHARFYLEVQKIIFKDQIDIRWEIEEEVKNCEVVRLILQPLLENAIMHGVRKTNRKAMIKLSCYQKDGDLYMEVWDNGSGIDKEKLMEIQEGLKSNQIYKSEQVGLFNVNWRIKLYFGKEYGVSVYSKKDMGTMVRIHMKVS